MLSEEDKRRIEEEERYRAEVRSKLESGEPLQPVPASSEPVPASSEVAPVAKVDAELRSPSAGHILAILAILGFVGILVMVYLSAGESSPGQSSVASTGVTPQKEFYLGKGGALCGDAERATLLAYQALQNGDKAGVLGLTRRHEVMFLEFNTLVRVSSESGSLSISTVNVKSGTNIGKRCWMPTAMLPAN
jgi:hypothetical protein